MGVLNTPRRGNLYTACGISFFIIQSGGTQQLCACAVQEVPQGVSGEGLTPLHVHAAAASNPAPAVELALHVRWGAVLLMGESQLSGAPFCCPGTNTDYACSTKGLFPNRPSASYSSVLKEVWLTWVPYDPRSDRTKVNEPVGRRRGVTGCTGSKGAGLPSARVLEHRRQKGEIGP